MRVLDKIAEQNTNTISNESISTKMLSGSSSSSSSNLDDDKNGYASKISLTKKGGINHKEKVKKLIETIKMKQDCLKSQSQSSNLSSEKHSQLSLNFRSLRNEGASYQNRFQAQKNIIDMQKIRLQEQEKIINELKLGILSEEVKGSLNRNKNEIKELFNDCKMKLIGKVNLDYVPVNEREKFQIKTQTAPKIVQELEQRSLERMKYREMIKERKRILEETKRKMQEEALEQKKILQQEEKEKQLELIKQRRKEELIKMKLRQAMKENFLRDFEKAVKFYNGKLLANSFSRWKFEYKWSREKQVISEEHYKRRILGKSFGTLLYIVEIRYILKFDMADEFYRKKILKKILAGFKHNHMEAIRSMQVAEDFNDLRLQCRTMDSWNRYIRKERILRDIKMQQAILQYNRKLIFQSFFRWKSLPTVLKLEKAREERKQKWRMKVWEILPDFSPAEL